MVTTVQNVVACVGGGETSLTERPVPQPTGGEMLLGLRVVGFCGTDLFKLRTGTALPGTVLGHEIVGDVIELGPSVTKFAVGDRVVVPHHVPCGTCVFCRRGNETMCETFRENLMEPGGFADRILIRARATEHAAHRVPKKIDDKQAVFMEPAACVLRGVRRSGLIKEIGRDRIAGAEDPVVAIIGAGSMGLLHELVLKAVLPEAKTVLVDLNAERRAIAETLGADVAATPSSARDAVIEISNGEGADAVFDTVGGATTLTEGLALTRFGGTVILFAHAPENAVAGFDLNSLFKYERRVIGSYSGSISEQREILDLIIDGTLDPSPLVTHVMPLDNFADGVALVEGLEALKVLFTPSLAGSDV
jgi:L-iditol 2-dehydrogenase